MDKTEMKEKFNKKMEELGEKMGNEYEKFMDNVEIGRLKGSKFVRQNPEKALAMTFGAGLVAGIILAGLMRRGR